MHKKGIFAFEMVLHFILTARVCTCKPDGEAVNLCDTNPYVA